MVSELDRFVDEHLTAASVMVPLAEPLPPSMSAREAKVHMDEHDFDMAVVEDDRLRIVTRTRLEALPNDELDRGVVDVAEPPRRDRLIEESLPLRQVAGALLASREPLLVVGQRGVTHIVTAADFAGVAGSAAVLSFLLAVDRGVNALLRPRAEQAFAAIGEKQLEAAQEHHRRAAKAGAALELIDYLSMSARFRALRKLELDQEFKLGSKEDHDLLVDVRNEAAHVGLADPTAALRAIAVAEWMLASLAAVDDDGDRL